MRRSQLRRLIGERIVVHTKDDRSLRGVVKELAGDVLVLGDPEYLAEAQPTPMPGEVWIEAGNRSWIQRTGVT